MRLPGRLVRGPLRPDRASMARFASLRWAALPVIDRRWTAPMSAVALGFGLFVGVAIGPGTEGSLGTSKPVVIQVPAPAPQTALAPDAARGGRTKPGQNGGDDGGGAAPVDSPPAPPPLDSLAPAPVTTPPIAPAPTTTPPPVTTTDEGQTSTETGADEAPATMLSGTVVHRNPEALSYTIAADDGSLAAVHSRQPPQVGKVVEVEAGQLANGTYVEEAKRKEGKTRGRAELAGTVSFRDPVTGAYTVSGPGASLLVRGGPQRTPPGIGERVEVEARIADHPEPLAQSAPGEEGCGAPPAQPKPPPVTLEQAGLRVVEGGPATSTDVEAIVEGVCRGSRKLIVSADDLRESGEDIALAIPKRIRVASLKPGQVLKLTAKIGESGALTVSSVAGDEGTKGAEDADLVQP